MEFEFTYKGISWVILYDANGNGFYDMSFASEEGTFPGGGISIDDVTEDYKMEILRAAYDSDLYIFGDEI